MPIHYPDWIMRLYVDLERSSSTADKICALACTDSNLDICDVKYLPGTHLENATLMFPMNWRFLPTLDKQVCLNLVLTLNLDFLAQIYIEYYVTQ